MRNQRVLSSNNTPSLNTSSSQATESIPTAPSAKEINNTSLIPSTDNTINKNP